MQGSPQIVGLRKEEAELLSEYDRRGGKADGAELAAPRPLPREAAVERAREQPEDSSTEMLRERLRTSMFKYNQLLERIDGARIELDTARAAFKYRYSVVRPAALPKKPLKPNAALLIAAGVVGGIFLAFFGCAATDLRRGRVLERWQLERSLGLPVLAVVSRP